MGTLLIIIGVLLCLILIVAIVRSSMYPFGYDYDDEVVTHTTVTTTTTNEGSGYAQPTGLNVNGIPVVGILERQWDGSTPFVIDPVDNDKMFLNTKDDLYEDGAGKVWGLK